MSMNDNNIKFADLFAGGGGVINTKMIGNLNIIPIFELRFTLNSNDADTETKTKRRPTVESTAVVPMHRMGVDRRDLLPLFNQQSSIMRSTNDETWKPVYRFENHYEVSSIGRIRRTGSRRVRKVNYSQVYPTIMFSINKKHTTLRVHRIVAIAFCPNYKEGDHVNHIDGNKKNFLPSNLEWVSQAENNLHSYRSLKRQSHFKGKTPWNKKLNNLESIRVMHLQNISGSTTDDIGKEYGVCGSTIRKHLRKYRRLSK